MRPLRFSQAYSFLQFTGNTVGVAFACGDIL